MTLYLVRHAIAEPRGKAWPDDALRPVTGRGATRMRAVAEALAARGVVVDHIWSSPLTRARQTAEILAPRWTSGGSTTVVPALAPGHTPAATAEALSADRVARAAAVGHEPELGILAAWLLGARHPLPFKKGGVACLNVPMSLSKGSAALLWLVTPRLVLQR